MIKVSACKSLRDIIIVLKLISYLRRIKKACPDESYPEKYIQKNISG